METEGKSGDGGKEGIGRYSKVRCSHHLTLLLLFRFGHVGFVELRIYGCEALERKLGLCCRFGSHRYTN